MRLTRTIIVISLLATPAALAEETYLNVASQQSLDTADKLGKIQNALNLHKEYNGKCDLSPLLELEKFADYYGKLTWSLSPSDLALIQKHYSDAQRTWSVEFGGVPVEDCDFLAYKIMEFDIGIQHPRNAMMSILNSAPIGSSEYIFNAATVASGLYIGNFMSCPNYAVVWSSVDMVRFINPYDFIILFYLARMAAVESPSDCDYIEPLARAGGVYRAKSG